MIHALALMLPGYLRFGGLHVPVYGLFAAAGLVAALLLSQHTARLAKLQPGELWDAGMFAVLAAFVASRALLFLSDPAGFLKYPLLLMSLPSLTYSGMLLTGLLTLLWLRWKKLPMLNVADAWAPCGALLWAVLCLGHFVEGTDAGMPTRLPWGVITPGDTVLGRTHPVQLYTMAVALVLCAILLQLLRLRDWAGEDAAVGLIVGGSASFLLGMLRQPYETFGSVWLDPAQFVAIFVVMGGACIWTVARSLTETEQAKINTLSAEDPR